MKIGLYIEHGSGNGVGGAELMMAHLASVWSQDHDVDLIHHRPPLTRERLSIFSQDNFARVTIRAVPREPDPQPWGHPLRRLKAARDWHASLSAPYDLFVNCTHWLPSFCHAKAGALLVLFPFYVRPADMPEAQGLPAWKRLRMRAYYEVEWRQRLNTYQHRWAISEYSKQWTQRRWGVTCDVVSPPVDVNLAAGPKQNLILTVGRFSTMAHTKKQLELVRAFSQLRNGGLENWSFSCVGGLNDRAENRVYFEKVRDLGRQCGATVQANVDRSRVREQYARARIYWHATGLDEDTDARPELAEHFGISTVEAMAAGCVPIVINKGGQSEIVRHGETGFVWNTLSELNYYTELLTRDDALWARMSRAARLRAQDFTRERFVERLSRACGVGLSPGVPAIALSRELSPCR